MNGQWSQWTSWSSCSQTCGGGIRTRQRQCNNPPPSNGGQGCVGNRIDQLSCNTGVCPPGKKIVILLAIYHCNCHFIVISLVYHAAGIMHASLSLGSS